jgi:hypothetical protein
MNLIALQDKLEVTLDQLTKTLAAVERYFDLKAATEFGNPRRQI